MNEAAHNGPGNTDSTDPQPDGTREALIAAGRELFALHGYDGASVRAITARAGANLGAITYHFGSKRALYDEVVRRCLEPLAERVLMLAQGSATPLDRIGMVARAFADYMRANPDIPRLMLQALVQGQEPPRAALPTIVRMHGALAALVREGQADGSIRPGDPALLAIGVVSHPLHLVLVGRALKTVVGLDLDDPGERARVLDHVAAFARAALAARAEGGS
ncbi:MAG TPA: TetR/AcrR family transcriptional regulator [Longimicrobiales bacterium]